jgi:hypothetical protein
MRKIYQFVASDEVFETKICIYSENYRRIRKQKVLKPIRFATNLVNNQPDALFFFNVFIYFTSLHVSSNPVLIIR